MSRGRKPKTVEAGTADLKTAELKEAEIPAVMEVSIPDGASVEMENATEKAVQARRRPGRPRKEDAAKKEDEKPDAKKAGSTAKNAAANTPAAAESNPSDGEEPKPARRPGRPRKEDAVKKENKTKKSAKQTAKKPGRQKKTDEKIILQVHGLDIEAKVLIDRSIKDWTTKGHKKADYQSIELYIKPEERAVYYVINKYDSGKIGLE